MRKKTIMLLITSILLATFTLTGCISPPVKVPVPKVIDLHVDTAIELVESKRLNPDALKGDPAPEQNLEDIVYWQAPDAGTRVRKGSIVNFIFYDEIPVEPRVWAILGTCLDTCQYMWKEIGGGHYKSLSFYGNRYGWPGHDLVEELGMKMFINIRADDWRFSPEEQEELSQLREYVKSSITEAKTTGRIDLLDTSEYQNSFKRYKELRLKSVPNEEEIQRCVNEWKNRPGCGGYWTDGLGHEPDICGPDTEARLEFYRLVRKYDPGIEAIQERPVMEMFNMTEAEPENPNWPYPGWAGTFHPEEKFRDLALVDCYPGTGNTLYWIDWAWETFIKKYCKKNQVIIQMQAFNYEPGMIWTQYNRWKELMASEEWDNPYKSPMGLCWYKDETIRQSGEMQQEIREVIADAMR